MDVLAERKLTLLQAQGKAAQTRVGKVLQSLRRMRMKIHF